MKKPYNIKNLKQKRQLNVQEQNALAKHEIKQVAVHWMTKGIAEPIQKLLCVHNIDHKKAIFVQYVQDKELLGGDTDAFTVVTTDKRFFDFDLELNENRTKVISYSCQEITEEIEIMKHKKGVGKTYGYLVLEILEEIFNTNIIDQLKL